MKKFRILIVLSFIISCLMILVGCGTDKIATPDIKTFKVDEATLSLSWDPVKEARGYKILVNNEEYVSKKPSYPLDPLVPGDYIIVVQAISDNEELEDSDWSKAYEYKRVRESGLSYSLINNNTEYEVRGLGSASGDVVIDDTYRGKPVTKIGDMAFANKSKEIKSVTLGKNIRSIGTRAFYNCALMESVEIKDSVTEIGAYAFQGCRTLTEMTLPKNLKSISNYTFAYCRSLESVVMPSGLTEIGAYAFSNCDKLDNVEIPNTVKTVGEYAFAENVAMTKLTIGNSLETIPQYAFLNCSALTSVTFGDHIKMIDEYAFSGCASLTAIALPNSVETIGKGAFINCLMLASIDLSDNLTSLGAGAFQNTFVWIFAPGIVTVDGWVLGPNVALTGEDQFERLGGKIARQRSLCW